MWPCWWRSRSTPTGTGGVGRRGRPRRDPGPALAEWLDVEGQETLSCFHFPPKHRRRIRTTNGVERVNQELKRRTRVVRIFPNLQSCLRLAAALLKEYHEDWITGRRYLRMDVLDRRSPIDDLRDAA